MTDMTTLDSRDLMVSRVIKAPVPVVWAAWTDPRQFEQWWVPAPAVCRVDSIVLEPGGAFRTMISEDGGEFGPHLDGCVLAVDHQRRIVFTTALVEGWRPAVQPFVTSVITFAEHPEGTLYEARALHKDVGDRAMHDELGFQDGWGTVTRQLAELAEGRS